MMSKNLPKSKQRINDSLQQAFNVFDKNGDGFITVEEMKCVLSMILPNLRTGEKL